MRLAVGRCEFVPGRSIWRWSCPYRLEIWNMLRQSAGRSDSPTYWPLACGSRIHPASPWLSGTAAAVRPRAGPRLGRLQRHGAVEGRPAAQAASGPGLRDEAALVFQSTWAKRLDVRRRAGWVRMWGARHPGCRAVRLRCGTEAPLS